MHRFFFSNFLPFYLSKPTSLFRHCIRGMATKRRRKHEDQGCCFPCASCASSWPLIFLLRSRTGFLALLFCAAIPLAGRAEVAPERKVARLEKPVVLKVATFNVHDMYVESANRSERMRAIADKLCALDPDLVGFQEAFIKKDRKILMERLEKGSRLAYHRYYPSGVVGSGLLISSAYPIVEHGFFKFSESNPFYKIKEGDWWAGKGVALARVELAAGGVLLDFYNTHAQASYGKPEYKVIRKKQMVEVAGFINRTRTRVGPLLLVGDMNCWVGQEDFEAVAQGADLRRAMKINSRIDHIFAGNDPHYRIEVLDTVGMAGKIAVKEGNVALSDHRGYMSTLRITRVEP